MVAVDEPGIETGEHVGRRPTHLGVNGDDRGADEPIAGSSPR
jgi:hypothetical protein